jgi:hypothetical protein
MCTELGFIMRQVQDLLGVDVFAGLDDSSLQPFAFSKSKQVDNLPSLPLKHGCRTKYP